MSFLDRYLVEMCPLTSIATISLNLEFLRNKFVFDEKFILSRRMMIKKNLFMFFCGILYMKYLYMKYLAEQLRGKLMCKVLGVHKPSDYKTDLVIERYYCFIIFIYCYEGLLNCENYERGPVSRIADMELVHLSHTSFDHQVQFLLHDELSATKQIVMGFFTP